MRYYSIALYVGLYLLGQEAVGIAEWNFFTYMQAKNNLAKYVSGNIDAMKEIGSTEKLNILVQMDVAKDPLTHRVKILEGCGEEITLPQKAIYNPSTELISATEWAISYPAKKIVINLWSHGTGSIDRSRKSNCLKKSSTEKNHEWLGLFHTPPKKIKTRGILYNYPKKTYLSVPMLGKTCTTIAQMLDHKINILGADACLMAMIEVAYEIRDSVEYFVASEQIIPCSGWPYSNFLQKLASNPSTSTIQCTRNIVDAFEEFYTDNSIDWGAEYFTLSSIHIARIPTAVKAFSHFVDAIRIALSTNSANAVARFRAARAKSLVVDIENNYPFIDLIDFYNNIIDQFTNYSTPPELSNRISSQEAAAANLASSIAIQGVIEATEKAKNACLKSIVYATASQYYQGRANGISIYFPQANRIERSYRNTQFAQDTGWPELISTMYRRL